MYVKSISGVDGEISIPSMGATIGTTAKWTLQRREDRNGPEGVYVFRAVFVYLNPMLFNEDSFKKEIKVRVGRGGQEYRIEPVEGSSVTLEPPTLVMEEVNLWPVE